MSLTERALSERKWGRFPEIRKAFEQVPVDWWEGGSSITYGYIEQLTDHLDICRAVLENRSLVSELEPGALQRDLHYLRSALRSHQELLAELDDQLRDVA